MATVNTRGVDASRKDENGDLLLGFHSRYKAAQMLPLGEVESLLGKVLEKRKKDKMAVPASLENTLNHCKRFRATKPLEDDAMVEAKMKLVKKVDVRSTVDESQAKRRRCEPFEAIQLLSFMPSTVAEAKTVVPSLKDNPFTDSLVDDLEEFRKQPGEESAHGL
mmetsp:Transcript_47654/g.102035  ORF Transcript_47654/g.102035 Transcript_47654/m.102035 type:complete len:164 (+) Transcript_47654:58-549(+)